MHYEGIGKYFFLSNFKRDVMKWLSKIFQMELFFCFFNYVSPYIWQIIMFCNNIENLVRCIDLVQDSRDPI